MLNVNSAPISVSGRIAGVVMFVMAPLNNTSHPCRIELSSQKSSFWRQCLAHTKQNNERGLVGTLAQEGIGRNSPITLTTVNGTSFSRPTQRSTKNQQTPPRLNSHNNSHPTLPHKATWIFNMIQVVNGPFGLFGPLDEHR